MTYKHSRGLTPETDWVKILFWAIVYGLDLWIIYSFLTRGLVEMLM